MAPKFGTSGLRGLVTELTPALVADHVAGFLAACETGGAIWVGRDLRPSSPEIAEQVIATCRGRGVDVVDAGVLPTPALALGAMAAGAGAVMVTGSHIPADRNGLKFYTPRGEIGKADEAAILAALGAGAASPSGTAGALTTCDAGGAYRDRYLRAWGPGALGGLRVGLYQHSSVARDLLGEILAGLGAEVIPLARSETFIPVDTEAVDPETRALLRDWCAEHRLDALVSTDGDADRPMLVCETGALIPGDGLGAMTARALGADTVVTPVNSNTQADAMGFDRVIRTRIGSPFVIAGMEEAGGRVVGYEANGGTLLGFDAEGPAGPLPRLATRDAVLPILAPLAEARATGRSLSDLVADLPARFTAADRLQGVESARAQAFLAELIADPDARAAFFAPGPDAGPEAAVDLTDGLRVRYADGVILHLRPSGNAPEFRCYAEADSPERAEALLSTHLDRISARLG